MRVALVTLGCDKNTVDSERYLAELVAAGAEPVREPADADVVIVNTCGFIDAAKQESIDAIVSAGRLKEDGRAQAVVAVGCMVQRHEDELVDALPEVDLMLGTSDSHRLVPELQRLGLLDPHTRVPHPGDRALVTDLPFVRYLKVSEGCDHGCAFCAIPLMRGKHRSFALADVIRDAQLLEMQGAREVNLVAQDLAHYGRDRRDGTGLPELLEALVRETGIPWFRNLYLYSAGITPRLLEVVASNPRILPYLDMPMQHGHDAVLARMRRPERQQTLREKVRLFREAVPDLTIRTTVIVGFPGETDDEFAALLALLEELQFDRVGCFTYSPQEGTRAWALPDDIPDPVKRERQERVLELQRHITAERYDRHVGREAPVLVERRADDGTWLGRAPWQADDIDGLTAVDGEAAPGTIVRARIDAVVDDYDFRATAQGILVPAPAPAAAGRARTLPVFADASGRGTISAFGK